MPQLHFLKPEANTVGDAMRNTNRFDRAPDISTSVLALKNSLKQSTIPESPRHTERHDVKETTRNSLLNLAQQIFYPLLGV